MPVENFPKITVILRGYTYSQIRTVVKNLVGTSLRAVEITMNTPGAVEAIRMINEEFGDQIMVGAGTVLTYQEAEDAIRAGAVFLLSPTMLDKKIIELCRAHKVISVPGAYSPSEIRRSFDDGADIVKVFPAGRLGSRYISDIQAPLGAMPLMVVGGINTDNVQEYFAAGAGYAGIASGIFSKEDILNENEEGIRASIQAIEQKLSQPGGRNKAMSSITLRESLILRFDQKMTNTEVLSAMCDNLCRAGIVKASYKAAVLEREEAYPTGLRCDGINIAIPHADIVHVNEAAISVAILKEPVPFKAMDEPDGDVPISIVIMLALTEEHGHIEMLQKIVGLIQNQAELQKMIDTDDHNAVMELMEKELLNESQRRGTSS